MTASKQHRHIIDVLFVLALFAMFALSSVLLIAIGVNVYRSGTESMQKNDIARTSCAYITEKVRRADVDGNVRTESFGDADALLLQQDIDGVSYTTYLYVHKGMLTELLARSDVPVSPASGQAVMALQDLSLQSEQDGILRIRLTETDGSVRQLLLHLRSRPARRMVSLFPGEEEGP